MADSFWNLKRRPAKYFVDVWDGEEMKRSH
jgi:hypothetical protein